MAAIVFDHIGKSYGKEQVLHELDLQVEHGEFLIVVGPSGCGKSTLLRLLAGLEEISAGTISIDGRVVNRLEPSDRDIAMVFQNYALYPHMSVYKNMAYGLKIRRMSRDDIRRRIDKAADMLQLDRAMLARRPRQLSGGQRQRVAMGRAIVREPRVFLFDEPLSNLDAKLRVQMRIEIKRLHQLLGITTLYVTHDQVEAMTLGQRLVVMNAGRIEQVGPPAEVYDRPATRFVAGFIGSPAMNFMAGTVDADGRGVSLADGVCLRLPDTQPELAGRAVAIGVRPEHLTLREDGPFRLTVELVEDLGADSLLYAYGARQSLICRLPGHSRLSPGEKTTLGVAPDAPIHLFDVDSQQRLNRD